MRKSSLLLALMSLALLSVFSILPGCGGDKDVAFYSDAGTDTTDYTPVETSGRQSFGVVAFTSGGIGIIDGKTKTVAGPLLNTELGSSPKFDVVISPDGKTTLVSSYYAQRVFFIDTSNPSSPAVKGSVEIGFSGGDMDITPDGRYALVTGSGMNGKVILVSNGMASKIAVLDVAAMSLVNVYDEYNKSGEIQVLRSHDSVAVASDGKTVLTTDYYNRQVHALLLCENGQLTFVCSTDVSNSGTLYPVNLAISPDGKTAIVASAIARAFTIESINQIEQLPSEGLSFPVLTILAPGVVKLVNYVTPCISQKVKPDMNLAAAQSIIFNRAGTKAYLYCRDYADYNPFPDAKGTESLVDSTSNTMIIALNILAQGIAMDAGTPWDVGFYAMSESLGIDTLALDYDNNRLWISNMIYGGQTYLQVLDVKTGLVVKTIIFDPELLGLPSDDVEYQPFGLYYWND
ncbi:MAG TPA: hypothetical protein PLI53_03370 [Geobacteraceae bacterium]|nr:hypothetical protein [Geobacteraceae bacterium]